MSKRGNDKLGVGLTLLAAGAFALAQTGPEDGSMDNGLPVKTEYAEGANSLDMMITDVSNVTEKYADNVFYLLGIAGTGLMAWGASDKLGKKKPQYQRVT